jgi:hypothetical protein
LKGLFQQFCLVSTICCKLPKNRLISQRFFYDLALKRETTRNIYVIISGEKCSLKKKVYGTLLYRAMYFTAI